MCTKATWRGQTVCAHSVPKYDKWAVDVGQTIKLVAIRGSYSNLPGSAGTDNGGGHLDVEMDGYDITRERKTETVGRADDLLVDLRLWAGNHHCHSLDPECPDLSPEACQQFELFRQGLDQLTDDLPDSGDRSNAAHILYLYDHRLDPKTAPTPDPSPTPAKPPTGTTRPLPWKGVDVSRYTDLSVVQTDAKALDFELVMCTEGKGYNAPEYGAEMSLVRAGTAMAGAVHYAWPENGWQADYNHFKAQAGLRAGEAGALDFEPWHTSQPNADPATFPEYVIGWTSQFKKDFGVYPLFYSPDYFVNLIKQHATAAQWAQIAALPFWKAGVDGHYVTSTSGGPGSSLGFTKIAAWQWSDKPLDQDLLYVPWSSLAVTVGGTSGSTVLDTIPVVFVKPPTTSTSGVTTYIVRSGDTLSGIAAKYHVSVAQLVSWNGIKNPDVIQVGEHIRLVAPTSVRTYRVVSGDTLGGIAAKFKVTVAQLVSWNHIANPNLIYPGQVLRIGTAPAATTTAHRYYTVQSGDTLSGIASKFHATLTELVTWNGIKNPNLIYPGERFRVG